MASNASLVGQLMHAPVLRRPWQRRALFAGLLAISGLLTLFPERQRAAMSLTPENPPNLSLGSGLNLGGMGQMSGLGSVFGNQTNIEVSLKVAHGAYVRNQVVDRLKLDRTLGMSRLRVLRWLERKVDIRALRGGILQFEVKLSDGQLAREIVAAYGNAVRDQVASIGRSQSSIKKDVLLQLVSDASDRLQKAQAAFDSFRLQTGNSAPQAALMASGERVPMLEQLIKAKQVELAAERQFATDRNVRVRQRLAELAALEAQLAEAKSTSPTQSDSVAEVVRESTQADRLRRDLSFAQLLYESYARYLQTNVSEELTSTINVRVLEPAYIDPARQYNTAPLLAGVLILLLGLAFEFYTLRPPVGDRKLV